MVSVSRDVIRPVAGLLARPGPVYDVGDGPGRC